jgi:hypothetical protein
MVFFNSLGRAGEWLGCLKVQRGGRADHVAHDPVSASDRGCSAAGRCGRELLALLERRHNHIDVRCVLRVRSGP